MRKLTQQEIEIVCLIERNWVVATFVIGMVARVSTRKARAIMNELASIGAVKRHPYSCANCIKWTMNKESKL